MTPTDGDIYFTRTSEKAKKNADRIISTRPLLKILLTIVVTPVFGIQKKEVKT